LEEEEWSEALLKILILKAGDFVTMKVGKGEWDRLIRITKNILSTNLKGEVIKWRVLGLILSSRPDRLGDDAFFMDNLKSLLNTNLRMAALLPSELLHKSKEFLTAFYHPITFRFLTRLNRRSMQGNPALLVLLGHQSLETQNYDDAAKMYLKAGELCPQWPFVKLCVGNALLGRAFQRTCSNQLAKLMQAVGYFLEYVHEAEETENDSVILQAWFNVARAFHQAGFLSQAVKFYRKCIDSDFEEDGHVRIARYNLSRLYLQCGSIEMARLIQKK
jgi:tetratricopeptide (TPR) repeat protein